MALKLGNTTASLYLGSTPVAAYLGAEQVYSATSTALLLNFNGANEGTTFTDSSPNALAVTANGDAQISTAQSKFGGASALFDGNDFVSVANSEALAFGSGDFTIEFWIYPLTTPVFVLGYGDAATAPGSAWSFHSGGTWDFYHSDDQSVSLTPPSLALNAWNHVSVVRTGGDIVLFLDGIEVDRETIGGASINTVTSPLKIGAYAFGGTDGYIDDLRILKGRALYTDNFTPPTAQLGVI
jgi:hypothetical protein